MDYLCMPGRYFWGANFGEIVKSEVQLRRIPLPRTPVNRRAVTYLKVPLPTLCSRWAAGCYVRRQREEEVHSEPGRVSDTHSRLDRVGVWYGVHRSQLKAWRQSRAALALSEGRPTGSHTLRAADGGQANFLELRYC